MTNARTSRWLIIGAMIVAAPRYVGVNAHAEGWLIAGDVWRWVVALSGLGMAVLEGVAVWYCWQRWGEAQPSPKRNVLMGLIVTMLVTLLLMVAPYTFAASEVALVTAVSAFWLHVVWSIAVSAAPVAVMTAVGLADTMPPVDAPQAQGEAQDTRVVSQTVIGEISAVKTEFLQAQPITQPAPILVEPAVMPSATVTANERAAQYLLQNPTANSEQVAQHLGVSAARVRALPAWRNRQPA